MGWIIFFAVVILSTVMVLVGAAVIHSIDKLADTIKQLKIGFTITTKNDDEDDWWKHPKN